MNREYQKTNSFLRSILSDSDRFGHASPLRLFSIIIASIFFAEIVAMIVVRFIEPLPYYQTTLIDAGIMTVLIFPFLYLFSFSPLLQHIEKLRKAEQALQQKEELQQRFFNSIDTLIAYMDREFNFISVNEAYAREEACSREDFIGKNYFELYPNAENLAIFEQVARTGEAYSINEKPFEFPSQPERGTTYWNWSLQPVFGSEGTVEGVVLSQVNVTERKRAEQQIREMALFPALNPAAVLQVRADGGILTSNPTADQMGLRAGSRLGELIPALRNVDLEECIAAGTTQSIEETRLGERILHWTIRGAPELGAAFLYSADITERVRSEEAVRLLSSVVEQTADTVVVTNCEGQIEYVNPAFESLTGYQRAETLGQTPRVIKSGVHDNQFYRKLWETILNGQPFHGEITNRKKNGEVFHEVKTITPLRNPHGEITHFVATGKDITERKLAEEQLRRAYDDLEVRVQDRTEELRIANAELEDEINVRWRAEALLQQSEKRLKRAQEIAHLGSWELDLQTNQLTWSDEVYRIFGLEPQEFSATYEAFLDAVHPDDRAAVNEAYLSSIREGRDNYEIEHRISNLTTGEIRIVHEKCEHFRDDEGKIIRSVGMVHDITERKRAEEQLATTNRKLNEILSSIQDDFYVLDRNWNFVYANPLFTAKVGKAPENLIGYNIWEIFPKHIGTIFEENFRATMEKREVRRFEIGGKYTDAWYRMTAFPSAEGITVLATDITARKKAEEALRLAHEQLELRVQERTEELATANRELSNEIAEREEIERQLRIRTAAMDAAANGIIITDPTGVILWSNPAITQITGYSSSELVGQSTRLFNSGRQSPEFYQHIWETILGGKVWQGEVVNRRKDGGHYVEEQTITPVHDEHGCISHFIAVKQDITERKLMYSQLEDSNRELTTLTAAERQQRLLAEGLVESSVVLNMSLELHAVLDHIIEQTQRTIPYRMADIVLIEDGIATVARQWDFEIHENVRTIFKNDELKLQDFPAWETICTTKSEIMISDTQLEHTWSNYFGMAWVRSYLGAPLIYNDQIIGIINLISDRAGAFHEGMAKTLRAFAAPAAVAIQNARLYENEQHNRKIAEILSAASVALAQTLDIQTVLETILDYVQFVMPFDVAFVVLSEGEERYRIRAVRTGVNNLELNDALRERTIDLLSQPVIRSYFTKHESTFIPEAREILEWDPPAELAFLNCWLGIPLESMGKVLGIVVVAHSSTHAFDKKQIQLLEAVIKQAVVALQNAWLFEQVRSGRERLQQLSRHLVEIQENERKYIARELHDETSQSLTSLKLGLQVIEQKAAGHEQLMEQVIHLKGLADETLESLHHLAVNLRPASLDHLGLVDALNGLIQSTRQRSGLAAHLKIMGSAATTQLTEEMETSIYRIVQESITNVIRHAHATYVDVILEWQDDKIVIIIEDDGVGIDMERAHEKGHLGLIGMQERAEMLGGRLLVDSTPDIGTALVVEIPYAN